MKNKNIENYELEDLHHSMDAGATDFRCRLRFLKVSLIRVRTCFSLAGEYLKNIQNKIKESIKYELDRIG